MEIPPRFKHIFDNVNNRKQFTCDLSTQNIADEGSKWVAEALKVNPVLKCLSLGFTNISHVGMKHISNALKTNSTLRELVLGANDIGDTGFGYLAETLIVNRGLRVLHLGYCSISERNIAHVCSALKQNQSVRLLSLRQNDLGVVSAQNIADMLTVNESIEELDLAKTRIGSGGAACILSTLISNPRVKKLNFDSCMIDEGILPSLLNFLRNNRVLHTLSLNECTMENLDAVGDTFTQAFEANLSLCKLRMTFEDQYSGSVTEYLAIENTSFNTLFQNAISSKNMSGRNDFYTTDTSLPSCIPGLNRRFSLNGSTKNDDRLHLSVMMGIHEDVICADSINIASLSKEVVSYLNLILHFGFLVLLENEALEECDGGSTVDTLLQIIPSLRLRWLKFPVASEESEEPKELKVAALVWDIVADMRKNTEKRLEVLTNGSLPFYDSVLSVESGSELYEYKIHKFWLSQFPFFEAFLSDRYSACMTLNLRHCTNVSTSFPLLMYYIYFGELARVDEETIFDVLQLANYFSFENLKDECENYLLEHTEKDRGTTTDLQSLYDVSVSLDLRRLQKLTSTLINFG